MYHKYLKKSTFLCLAAAVVLAPGLVWAAVPTDPEYSKQAAAYNQINAPTAWDMATGSRKVVVAIIDTGVDIWHQDLLDNIWVNPGEIPDNGIDDDKNGYVDDVNGWNFVDGNNNPRPSVLNTTDDTGAVRHGTVSAGIIGAATNNGLDGAGINWRVQIMALRAVDGEGDGSYGEIGAAVDYAVNNGAAVIAMSFVGGSPDDALKEILHRAYERGVVIVAAAGNSRRMGWGDLAAHPLYPACFDRGENNWILGATSIDAKNQLSAFANYGACADLAAPGENIFSTERYAPQYGYNTTFAGPWNGTSFAVPFVAGAAALIKSIHPEWTADKIIANLINSSGTSSSTMISTPVGQLAILSLANAVAQARAEPLTTSDLEQRRYFIKQGEIYYRNSLTGEKSTYFAAIPGGVSAAVLAADFNNDWKTEVAALAVRAPYYYIRLIDSAGRWWREFNLDIGKGKIVKKIALTNTADDIPKIIAEVFDKKKNASQFLEYNVFGQVIKSSVPAARVDSWQITGIDDISAKVKSTTKKPKLTTVAVKWYND